ncbi:hypothetical protein BOW17_12365, partial [Solemya velum gill symbiont]
LSDPLKLKLPSPFHLVVTSTFKLLLLIFFAPLNSNLPLLFIILRQKNLLRRSILQPEQNPRLLVLPLKRIRQQKTLPKIKIIQVIEQNPKIARLSQLHPNILNLQSDMAVCRRDQWIQLESTNKIWILRWMPR